MATKKEIKRRGDRNMYQVHKLGKGRYVGIAQTGAGWNVSTWQGKGTKVGTFQSKNTKTLAEAKKEFTRQKSVYKAKETPQRPKRRVSRPSGMFGSLAGYKMPKMKLRW